MSADLVTIDSIESLNSLFDRSNLQPVVIFKHSSMCGISAHLLEEVTAIDGTINVVVVQESRDVSNAVEQRTGYRHQSPQAFVIRGGKAVYQASHYGIDPSKIVQSLQENE